MILDSARFTQKRAWNCSQKGFFENGFLVLYCMQSMLEDKFQKKLKNRRKARLIEKIKGHICEKKSFEKVGWLRILKRNIPR